jgi:hypothetical protein
MRYLVALMLLAGCESQKRDNNASIHCVRSVTDTGYKGCWCYSVAFVDRRLATWAPDEACGPKR